MSHPISCCTWALSGPDDTILGQIAAMGFEWIDIRPDDFLSAGSLRHIKERNLQVSCMGLSFGIPDTAALDHAEEEPRAAALSAAQAGIARAAALGCTTTYVIPGLDDSAAALDRYAASLIALADHAAAHDLRLCIEHFPGRALPSAAATLDFLARVGHSNLYLLFDIGHIQMAGEDPAAVIRTAGPRLGYVHLDDNDGVNDLHLSLHDGVLTQAQLVAALNALPDAGYTGPLSLELSPALPDPAAALAQSRSAVLAAQSASNG